jgi:hypothetical protein
MGRTPFSLTVRASHPVGIFGIIPLRISVSTQKSVPTIFDDGKIAAHWEAVISTTNHTLTSGAFGMIVPISNGEAGSGS